MRLNNLADNPGAIKKARRVGRGIGSSKGKTCGRGHKGQKARSGGNIHPSFEGGQTKFYRLLPKRGFTNSNATPMVGVNLGTLQDYVDMGRIDPKKQPLTMKDLVEAGITKHNSIEHGVKLLARGSERIKTPLVIEVSRASQAAITAMESIGGEITTVHLNRLALRALLKPQKFEVLPKRAAPPPRLLTYYRSFKNRGYLSPQVQMKNLLRMRPELADAANATIEKEVAEGKDK
ncbi:Pfam Ribosomal L18e [Fragilaria crotonensis]|nr:Pfam Ribosomal L18e [Fragilaria crotonensis]